MLNSTYFLILIGLLSSSVMQAQKSQTLISPDGQIVFNFLMKDHAPFYNISYKGKKIIENSSLGLQFQNGNFEKNLILKSPILKDTIEEYDLMVGKASHVRSHYREAILPLQENTSLGRLINIVIRVFDDGVAFRYVYPRQNDWKDYELLNEITTFRLAGDPLVNTLFLPGYLSSHEGQYNRLLLSEVKPDTLMDMPTLFELANNVKVAITEAALLDYAGMYLSKHNGVLRSCLSPLPNQGGIKVKASLPHKSPWRVLLISDRMGALLESNILTDLNTPPKSKDLSWIRPGKTTFPWWNGNIVPDTLNAPGNNFVTAQYYIDFCARNGLEYHSVVEYGLHQWYTDDGINFMPGPHADVTTPIPGLDMKQVCDYANQHGVGIRVWVHWAALYPKLDSAFTVFERWGIKGMMVDFMDRDDQEMVNIQTEILEKAAQHHLHIQFHGSYKPTGLNRTYPNEFTREGTLNYEANKWNPEGISPNHDIAMPFTRMLAGSTDYHLGGFRAVPRSQFKAQYSRPLMLGTRCHMLAMYVVLENYLQMVCDYPSAYEGESGFEFIKEIPTTWDEIKVPIAEVNKYIIVARRKSNDWYVGAITNDTARDILLPLSFLSSEKYMAEIYSDALDVKTNPNNLVKKRGMFTNTSSINLKLAAGGGTVIHFKMLE